MRARAWSRWKSQLRVNEAALAVAKLNLSYTRITAPIAGRISKAEVTAGNLVQLENPNTPVLTTIVSVNPIYVSFEATSRRISSTSSQRSATASCRSRWGWPTTPAFRTRAASSSSTTASIRRAAPCACAPC